MNTNHVADARAPAGAVQTKTKPSAIYSAVKRVLDLIFAVIAVIFAAIPMLVIIALIRIDTHESAIFTQNRVGRNGKVFRCYKYRTMVKTAPRYCAKKELQNADALITRTGKILRKTSLDELPQLFNILKGDMSFIGPRPLIESETTVHALREAYGVYALRPGISGYAQVHGRDMITDEKKAELDKYYLDHFSLATDIQILFGTVFKVLREEDIQQGKAEEPVTK